MGGRLAKKLAANSAVTISSRKSVIPAELKLHNASGAVLHESLLKADTFPKGINTVIHMAALNEWDCVKYPSQAIRVNIDETRIILENSIAAGVQNFIYFSTAHVYASPLVGFIDETTRTVPQHPYAITHKAAEDYVMAACLQKKIHGIVVRLSNSFGAPVLPSVNRWTLLTNDLCRQAIEKQKMVLLSNGCQYRDFVCLADVENVIHAMVNRPKDFVKLIYNLGSGESMRVIDMARLIAKEYEALFNEKIDIHLPEGAVETKEESLSFSVERLLEQGCHIANKVDDEIRDLLLFCERHFVKA